MLARTQLLHIQRSLYRHLQDYAKHSLGGLNKELRRYFEEYRQQFTQFESIATKRELLQKVLGSNLVLVGDYHTLPQAQRTVIRILRDLVPALKLHNRNIILALEMARPSDRRTLKSYLGGAISETAFLKKISFQRNWGFPWENYRSLFQFARESGVQIVGINRAETRKGHSLLQRDRFMAQELVACTKKDPKALVLALVGDLHLADTHLPLRIKQGLKKQKLKRELLVIHQNVERYYWNLVREGLEQLVDVVRVRKDVYCILNTPPWIKLQSHVRWLDWDAEGTLESTDEIASYVQMISDFFEIDAPRTSNFSVHSPIDSLSLESLERRKLHSKRELRFIGACLGEFKSFFIPRANILYLATLSPNHCAAQAALYVHTEASGFDKVFQDPQRDFYRFVWAEAIAFLGSKVINHKRKCPGRQDLERIADSPSAAGDSGEVARFVLSLLKKEETFLTTGKIQRFLLVPGKPLLFYYKAAKVIGALLGQSLYTAVTEEVISKHDLRKILELPLHEQSSRQNEALYFRWVKNLNDRGYQPSSHSERL